jgi:DNA-binding transcriptional LysR family regulator
MSPRILQIFVMVYREESISRAARRLNMSQPAVSSAIRTIENRYHIQLFGRKGRGIRRTPDADRLFEYASHIVALYSQMDQDLAEGNTDIPVRIGSSISIGACLLPQCIRDYMECFGASMPFLEINSSDIIEKKILENRLDFAMIEGNVHSDAILSEPLIDDHLSLICSPLHPLAGKKTVSLDDLAEQTFLLREKNSGTRELAQSTLMMHDFLLRPRLESTSTVAIINAVRQNLGLSILPCRMLTQYFEDGSLVELSIRGIRFLRKYSIIYHQNKYLSPDLSRTIDFFRESIRSQQ